MSTVLIRPFVLIVLMLAASTILAQETTLKNNYIGVLPSFLFEPYDTIDALETNFIPLVYELRVGERNGIGLQLRTIANYRFYKEAPGFSQIGATMIVNKYLQNLFEDGFWLKPYVGGYYTYTYNRLDKIKTMTLGIQPGVYTEISQNMTISLELQPGINYYPDSYSQEFVETESGFKSHFGVIFHIGYNF